MIKRGVNSGFPCPHCHGRPIGKILSSKVVPSGLRRQRLCMGCGKTYTTLERVAVEINPGGARSDD